MVSNVRSELIKFFNTEEGEKVARYLTRAPKLLKDIERFYDHDVDVNKIISTFQEGDEEKIELTRQFLDQYMDMRGGKMPTQNIPMSVRRSSTVLDAKDSFKEGIHSLTRGSVTKGTIDIFSSALSAAGLTEREKQIATAVLSTSAATTLISLMTNAHADISQKDVHSAMNSFNATSYSQSIDPLKVIIQGDEVRHYEGDYKLSPYLVDKMKKDPSTHQYMKWIIDAADANGIDPVLFANQIFKESIHFNKDVISGKTISRAGALGIAQFMPATGARYDLNERTDFFDPQKAIYAAARHMSDLTDDYDGDQVLALAAYNGGPRAVSGVKEQLGKDQITGDEWIHVMTLRQAQFGSKDRSAWHVETLDYLKEITGKWDTKHKEWAQKQQGNEPLLVVEDIMRGNSALAAINHASPTQNIH
jgi:hypothetical protein